MTRDKRKTKRFSPPRTSGKETASKPSLDRVRFEKVFERVYKMVLRIPHGRVMTYGQIARLLEGRYSPRLVGWAMHATPHDDRNIPWHRVINSKGGISTGRVTMIQDPKLQQYLLEAEGVVFNDSGHCDLASYQWSPRKPAKRVAFGRKKKTIRNGRKGE